MFFENEGPNPEKQSQKHGVKFQILPLVSFNNAENGS